MSAEGSGEGLDGLLMGNVSEDVTESDEQIAQRVAAAQARMAKIRKQEKKAKKHDQILAKIIPLLNKQELDFVIFAIDHELPSLTILSVLSIVHEECDKACHEEFHQYIEEKADFSLAKFQNKKVENDVATWWTFLVGADMISDTIRLKGAYQVPEFADKFPRFMAFFLQEYLREHHEEPYDQEALVEILREYAKKLFEIEALLELEMLQEAQAVKMERKRVERDNQ